MDAKYTPGPWRLGNDSLHGKALTVWAAEVGMCITSVFDASMGPEAPPMREALANARLIAAAPELYACTEFLSNLSEDGFNHEGKVAIRAARAAIAKARGKAKP